MACFSALDFGVLVLTPSDGKLQSTRLLIARECAHEARSIAEVAKVLSKSDGALRAVFQTMVRDGVLETQRTENRRGVLYRVSSAYIPLVQELVGDKSGMALDDAVLLTIGGRNLTKLLQTASNAAESEHFLWAARLDGPSRLLLAFRPGGAELVDHLQIEFEHQGAEVHREHIAERFAPRRFREWAAARLAVDHLAEDLS
jgi:hypothetical protein